jgi:hypothetical protein
MRRSAATDALIAQRERQSWRASQRAQRTSAAHFSAMSDGVELQHAALERGDARRCTPFREASSGSQALRLCANASPSAMPQTSSTQLAVRRVSEDFFGLGSDATPLAPPSAGAGVHDAHDSQLSHPAILCTPISHVPSRLRASRTPSTSACASPSSLLPVLVHLSPLSTPLPQAFCHTSCVPYTISTPTKLHASPLLHKTNERIEDDVSLYPLSACVARARHLCGQRTLPLLPLPGASRGAAPPYTPLCPYAPPHSFPPPSSI